MDFILLFFQLCGIFSEKNITLLFSDYFLPVQLKVETAEKKSSTAVIQRSFVATAQEDSGSQPCSFACVVQSPEVFKTPGDLTVPWIIIRAFGGWD